MTMPNFLVIGTVKAGTTAFYSYLKQHPDIYMSPKKEPRFFAYEDERLDYRGPGDKKGAHDVITDIQSYRELFQGVTNEAAIGEATPQYLYLPKAPKCIRHYIPNAKLIAILRDPAERAYSNFVHRIRVGRETLTDFAHALREEEVRIHNNWAPAWHYKNVGFYFIQLKRYFDIFDDGQIKVYLYEDFQTNPIGVLRDTFRFLDVDDTFVPDVSVKHNVSFIPRSRAVHAFLKKEHFFKTALKPLFPERLRRHLLKKVQNWNSPVKPPLLPETRNELVALYKEDILKLQDLIQRDLTKWLK